MLHFLIPSGDNCQTYRGLFLPPAKLLCYAQNLREELTDNLGKDRPPKQTASKSSEILLLSDLKTLFLPSKVRDNSGFSHLIFPPLLVHCKPN